jgi:hypothetical protein
VNEEQLRIGDAERDAAAGELGEHYAAGRLTAEEHAERLEQVWAARTRADLAPVFRDLPGRYAGAWSAASRPVPPAYVPAWAGRRGFPPPLLAVLAVLVVLTVLTHLPFVLVGLLVAAFVVTRHRRRAWHPRGWTH